MRKLLLAAAVTALILSIFTLSSCGSPADKTDSSGDPALTDGDTSQTGKDTSLTADGIPVLHVNIAGGKAIERKDKSIVQDAEFSISADGTNSFSLQASEKDGKTVYPMTIKGRGNSSWEFTRDKKPYKIKFAEKQDLLGMGEARSWYLISNWVDPTYMRNYIAYNMASMLTCGAVDCEIVALYINEKYEGIYLLTEAVELKKNRIRPAEDGSDKDGDGVISEYLIEAACEDTENIVTVDDVVFRLKEPDTDEITPVQTSYVQKFLEDTNEAILNVDGYEEYIDTESFIDLYLINELLKNPDFGFGDQPYYASTYMYMSEGGKLYFGYAWDFDIAFGRNKFDDVASEGYRKTSSPEGLLLADTKWVSTLLEDDEFAAKVAARWAEISQTMKDTFAQSLAGAKSTLANNYQADVKKWGKSSIRCTPWNFRDAYEYEEEVEYIESWMETRFTWFDEYWSGIAAK